MAHRGASLELEHRIRLEWYTVICLMSALTFLLSFFSSQVGLERLDHTFYDRIQRLAAHVPPSDEIVIVAIDDDSISQIGYWPWRRSVHAELLERLSQARVVGIDLLLSDLNPAFEQDDARLAQAMRDHKFVVLPLVVHPDTVLAPLSVFQRAAADLGSINATLDSDGVVRSLQCRHRTDTGVQTEHFVLAMLRAGGQPDLAREACGRPGETLGIPYVGPPGSYTLYPYAKVLSGEIPPSTFKDKYVLVGAWASALGDFFNVPSSSSGRLMAGVEILANALQGAQQDEWISKPGRAWMAALAMLPALFVCLMLRRLSPRRAFYTSVLVLGGIFVLDWAVLRYLDVWLPPTASLVGVIFAYPVWSWRSQEAALKHIDEQLKLLQRDISPSAHLHSPITILPDRSLPTRVTQLNQAISHIHRAERHREETLRFLSHDMRAPQSAILALLDMEAKNPGSMPPCVLMERVRQHALTTLKLADGFVHMAKAEMGALEHQDVDLADLLQECCDSFWEQSQQKGITFHCDSSVNDAWVVGDRDLLSRALRNLLDNALKYSPDGTTIRYSLERRGADWAISIQDQGCGLDSHQVDTLFRPFYRGNTTAPDGPDGVGLGLSFVQAVADRHGGTIAVHSEPGIGSIFTLTLRAAGNPKIRPDTRSQPS